MLTALTASELTGQFKTRVSANVSFKVLVEPKVEAKKQKIRFLADICCPLIHNLTAHWVNVG